MIAHRVSFAVAHPWLTTAAIWLTINVIIVCYISTRTVLRRTAAKRASERQESHRMRL
jgi:hypothetical protein